MKHSKLITNLLLLLIGVFFSFFFISKLPAGQHYDQLRYIINPEQQISGLVDSVSIRQIIANILLLAYPAVYVVQYLRYLDLVALIPLVPKVVTALFFLASLFVWKAILKELKFSVGSGIFFLLLLVTSGWFIIFGKFIPLLGGYLFYTSLTWYYFIRWGKSKKIIDLLMSSLFLVFTTFTHIFSVLLLPLSLAIYLFLSLKRGSVKLGELLASGTVAVVAIGIITATILFLSGYASNSGIQLSDNSLSGKDTSTILYQLSLGEYSSAISSYGKRLLFYLHPGFLVAGGFLQDTQVDTSFSFNDIKNPEFNHWQISGTGPFGFVALLIYFLPLFVKLRKDDKSSFFWALFVPYVLGAGFANFDNPSIARFVPYLVWIPYVITLYLEEIVQEGLEKKKNLLIYALILGVMLISSFFTLKYLYSDKYQQAEQNKFEMAYDEVFQLLNTHVSPFADVYFFQDERWNSHSYLEYYLSPTVASKTVPVSDVGFVDTHLVNKNGRFVFIFKDKKYLSSFMKDSSVASITARDEVTGKEQYIVYSKSLTRTGFERSCVEVENLPSLIPPSKQIYLGEEEFLTPWSIPHYIGNNYAISMNESITNQLNNIPTSVVPKSTELPVVNRKNVTQQNNAEIMTPSVQPAILDYLFTVEISGTYKITIVASDSGFASSEILLREGTNRTQVPKFATNKIPSDYTAVVQLDKGKEYVLSILAYRFQPVSLANTYTPILTVNTASLQYLGENITQHLAPLTLGKKYILTNNRTSLSSPVGTMICEVIDATSISTSSGNKIAFSNSNLVGVSNAEESMIIQSLAPLFLIILGLSYLIAFLLIYSLLHIADAIAS